MRHTNIAEAIKSSPGSFNTLWRLFGYRTWRGVIEKYGDFFQMIELSAGLNKNLMGRRGRPTLYINHSTDIQTRRINPILSGRHYVIAVLDFLETGNITHFNQRNTEIGSSSDGAERARLSELTYDGARARFLVSDEHHL